MGLPGNIRKRSSIVRLKITLGGFEKSLLFFVLSLQISMDFMPSYTIFFVCGIS